MPRPRTQPLTCIVRDPALCAKPATARGLCSTHRSQLARTGRLTIVRDRGAPRMMLPWRVPEYVVEVVRQVAAERGRPPGDVVEDALLGLVPEGD